MPRIPEPADGASLEHGLELIGWSIGDEFLRLADIAEAAGDPERAESARGIAMRAWTRLLRDELGEAA